MTDCMEGGRYKLRSVRRQEQVIPIEIQMAPDNDFISQMIGSSHPTPGQVDLSNYSSISDSDLNISGLMYTDENSGSKFFNNIKNDSVEYSGHVAGSSDPAAQTVDQNASNKVILDQLTVIGYRLDKMENQNVNVKKINDISKAKCSKKVSKILSGG